MADHDDHTLELGSAGHGCVWAECSCGWTSEAFRDSEAAVDAWENHCDVVFMEATTSGGIDDE